MLTVCGLMLFALQAGGAGYPGVTQQPAMADCNLTHRPPTSIMTSIPGCPASLRNWTPIPYSQFFLIVNAARITFISSGAERKRSYLNIGRIFLSPIPPHAVRRFLFLPGEGICRECRWRILNLFYKTFSISNFFCNSMRRSLAVLGMARNSNSSGTLNSAKWSRQNFRRSDSDTFPGFLMEHDKGIGDSDRSCLALPPLPPL